MPRGLRATWAGRGRLVTWTAVTWTAVTWTAARRRQVNLGIDMNSRASLVGPNGVGKSTLLKVPLHTVTYRYKSTLLKVPLPPRSAGDHSTE